MELPVPVRQQSDASCSEQWREEAGSKIQNISSISRAGFSCAKPERPGSSPSFREHMEASSTCLTQNQVRHSSQCGENIFPQEGLRELRSTWQGVLLNSLTPNHDLLSGSPGQLPPCQPGHACHSPGALPPDVYPGLGEKICLTRKLGSASLSHLTSGVKQESAVHLQDCFYGRHISFDERSVRTGKHKIEKSHHYANGDFIVTAIHQTLNHVKRSSALQSSQQPYEVSAMISSIFQMSKQRLREVMQLGQGHTAGKWQSYCLNPRLLESSLKFLITIN